jgi:hypothetical protein
VATKRKKPAVKKLKRKLLFVLPCGGHDVKVYAIKGLIKKYSAAGYFDSEGMHIEIDDSVTMDNFYDTLIHESIHACEHIFGFKLKHQSVRLTATGLQSMLKGFLQR